VHVHVHALCAQSANSHLCHPVYWPVARAACIEVLRLFRTDRSIYTPSGG